MKVLNSFRFWCVITCVFGVIFYVSQISPPNKSISSEDEVQLTKDISQDAPNLEVILDEISQDIQFSLLIPDDSVLPLLQLTDSSFQVNNISDNIDLFYKTPEGMIHIWQSKTTEPIEENITVNKYNAEPVIINDHEWFFDSILNLYLTEIDGTTIQVSGQVPNKELVKIINSLEKY